MQINDYKKVLGNLNKTGGLHQCQYSDCDNTL